MSWLANLQFGLYWLLALGTLALELAAFVDALRHPAPAYVAAFKRTRTFWLVLLGVMVLLGILSLPVTGLGFGLFGTMLVAVPAGVYFADVRPALTNLRRGRW